MNIKNFGVIVGRLTKDPKVFTNSDGSRKVMLTVAAQQNYKNAANERGTDFISLEAFVSNKSQGLGVYEYMHMGDMVGLSYTVKSNNYADKSGETVYTQVLQVTDVDLMESKASQARRAAVAANAAAVDAAPAAPVAPAETPAPAPKTSKRGRKAAKPAVENDECLPFDEQ